MQTNHPIDERITGFIKEHHVFTLATSVNDTPYCANIFYAWMEKEEAFVFTSSDSTRHGAEAIQNNFVAASIVLETKIVGKIRGLQVQGSMFRPEGELLERARKRYLRRFPYATVMELELWLLEPCFLKLTDNRYGFGKKIIWQTTED
jgi:Uncharacterized protein conserved in bacteria